MKPKDNSSTLREAREDFVTQWGTLGSSWGINRTMAQIHALLMTSPQPLSTDEIMDELEISRGNANANLRDLVGWGIVRSTFRKGERKEYFEGEKDVWKLFCTIARERKRRELTPALEVLQRCGENTKDLKDPEAKEFHKQMTALSDFLKIADRVLNSVATSEQSRIIPLVAKLFK